ncbi:hypothetical protein ACJPQ8_22750, partial [Vibrio parahaemolyticus]|uniref:hypothetical protein n=1 Tax=Vibrio parahaemolyticus TaxID=670 RepID=UPI001DFFED82|nr:hypothetical protein [Vibrio parahaemolyticus]EGR1326920.1 hypothetical protein [Vibrio parahaemolyticus]EGR2146628.1 hypothetical protein [Vibrio parahaemolyticus]EGR2548947.1 hypothetical protein [Vibrio parahaemolyticus]
QAEKRSHISISSGKSSKLKLSYWRSISVLISVVKIQNWHLSRVDLFFGVATFRFTELNFFAETLLVEFVGTKADLLAVRTFSLV